MYKRAVSRELVASKVNGIIAVMMAFSWTWYPNMKPENEQNTYANQSKK